MIDASMRSKLEAAGVPLADVRWLERFGFRDDAMPAVADATEAEAYRKRIASLTASVAALTFPERAASPQSRLAAALGARLADWEDQQAGEDKE
ncbi:MAG: hypothetical protein ACRCYS_04745 [Beijerinckiaceae bacterium]